MFDLDDPRLTAAEKVELWRFEQLLKAGYPEHVAQDMAAHPSHELDLHHAVELLEACGDPALAAQILL